MLKNYTLYFIITLLSFTAALLAQWEKCNGFSNEDIRSMITIGNNTLGGLIDKGVIISYNNGRSSGYLFRTE